MPRLRLLCAAVLSFFAIVAAIVDENNRMVRPGVPLPPLPEPVTNPASAALLYLLGQQVADKALSYVIQNAGSGSWAGDNLQ